MRGASSKESASRTQEKFGEVRSLEKKVTMREGKGIQKIASNTGGRSTAGIENGRKKSVKRPQSRRSTGPNSRPELQK